MFEKANCELWELLDFCLPFSEFISLTQYKTNSRLAPVPANTTVKTRSAAPTCAKPARPWLLGRGGSRVYRGGENLGMEGPEDNGGEGQLGREPGYSGGGQFFPKENLCKLLFVWILLSLSLVKVLVKVKFSLAPLVFVQYATACDQGLSAETCNASWKYILREKMRGVCLLSNKRSEEKLGTSWIPDLIDATWLVKVFFSYLLTMVYWLVNMPCLAVEDSSIGDLVSH